VAFSLDGKIIISVSENKAVCVWDPDTDALLQGSTWCSTITAIPVVFTPNSNTIAISPNGKWIAGCLAKSYTVEVKDLRTGQKVATFDVHANYVRSVAFSPDSKRIVTASEDKTIRIQTLNM
jgi:WD40 repeat protein